MKFLQIRGMTIIELLAVIVVAAIAIPVLMRMWATVSWQSVRSEGTAEATFYAQALMEEIKSKRFDENATAPWSSSLGVDIGENINNASTFDDVDDYINTTDVRILRPSPAYSRWATVDYVLLNTTNVWVACPVGTCQAVGVCPNCCAGCNECCYKRITVNVKRTDNILTNVSMVTVVAGY